MQRFTFRTHVGPTAVEEIATKLDATGIFCKRVLRGTEHVHMSIDCMTRDAAELDTYNAFKAAGLWRPRLQLLHIREPEE